MTLSSQLRKLAVALLLAPVALAQTAAPVYVPTLTFDVASVRQSPPPPGPFGVGQTNSFHSSNYSATNNSINNLISTAYGIRFYQIADEPDWGRAMFNVQAKSDAATDDKLAKLTDEQATLEKQHMLQVLLAERFNLKIHWESKELPTFDLVIAKNGPKLQPSKPEAPQNPDRPIDSRPKAQPVIQHCDQKGCEIVASGRSINWLAQMLVGQTHGTIADKTGLSGIYDFKIQYRGTLEEEPNSDATSWPPLMRALPEQLGLKLIPTKTPTPILVIDHIEKPTDN